IAKQRRGPLIDLPHQVRLAGVIVGVRIPAAGAAAVIDLHETDAALDKAASDEAPFAEAGAVEVAGFLRFAREIDRLRRGGLHAERQFIEGDAGFEFRVARALGEMIAVESLSEIEHGALVETFEFARPA